VYLPWFANKKGCPNLIFFVPTLLKFVAYLMAQYSIRDSRSVKGSREIPVEAGPLDRYRLVTYAEETPINKERFHGLILSYQMIPG